MKRRVKFANSQNNQVSAKPSRQINLKLVILLEIILACLCLFAVSKNSSASDLIEYGNFKFLAPLCTWKEYNGNSLHSTKINLRHNPKIKLSKAKNDETIFINHQKFHSDIYIPKKLLKNKQIRKANQQDKVFTFKHGKQIKMFQIAKYHQGAQKQIKKSESIRG